MLSTLSTEVLSLLLSDKSSFLVVSLWKCGDVALNRKLAKTIRHVDLKDVRLDSTSRYPKMLASLPNLRSLSLNRGEYHLTGSYTELISRLLLLPTDKLEKLSLKCAEVSAMLLDPRALALSTGPQTSFVYDLSTNFPALTSLSLKCGKLPSGKEPIHLIRLPPQLIILKTPKFVFSSDSEAIFSHLPRTLTSWKSQFTWRDKSLTHPAIVQAAFSRIFEDAPPNLSHLSKWQSINMPQYTRFADFLPKSLSTFEPENDFDLNVFDGLQCAISEVLIPANRYLESLARKQDILNKVNFTSLFLDLPYSQHLGLPNTIVTLPRTLTQLTISTYNIVIDDFIETTSKPDFWPPQLVTLSFSGPLPQAVVKTLPKSLTSLTMSYDDQTDKDRIALIPHNLSHFNLTAPEPINQWDMAPKEESLLSKLHLVSHTLDEKILSKLPDSVTDLFLIYDPESHICDPLQPIPLPCRLYSLSMESFSYAWFPSLPRTLVLFHIGSLVDFEEKELRHGVDLFDVLPSGLKSLALRVQGSNSNLLSAASFSTLPSLKVLSVTVGTFEPEVLEHLPIRLVFLEIKLSHLDEKMARFIPRFLDICKIDYEKRPDRKLLEQHFPLEAAMMAFDISDTVNQRKREALARSTLCPDPRIPNQKM